ncbi:MAG: carboxynorspermidine decarboxylase, partial [Desulfovibrio sp.]|nr:carboxynorspermidine decarboxylase [Desulfovibrio sp.]
MCADCLDLLLAPDSPAPSPCFVLDECRLAENAAILDSVQKATGAKILLALKGFAAWATFPLLSRAQSGPLWGVCASSVDEARLGREDFGGEVHAFAAAWSEEEFRELLTLCDHIVFNSLAQWRRFRPLAEAARAAGASREVSFGLRLNPEHSEGAVPIYDPCAPGSRLGIRPAQLAAGAAPDELDGISGLHFHTLCEQGADALERTLDAVETNFAPYLTGRRWLNFGGGHHITKPGYDRALLCRL